MYFRFWPVADAQYRRILHANAILQRIKAVEVCGIKTRQANSKDRRRTPENPKGDLSGRLFPCSPSTGKSEAPNFVSKHGYLDKEQYRIEQEADLAAQRSRAKEIAASVQQVRNQKTTLQAETRRSALDSVHEADQKAVSIEQELKKAEARGRLLSLTSPVDGTVQQLAVHTVGGVVTPAQALMVIVPQSRQLEAEVFLENKDVGFVANSQDVEVKIETFPYTKYGTVPASILSVSNDAIQDEKKGLVFSARVRLSRSEIMADGKPVNLSPGMAIMAEIKTGKRRVIEYFLNPLLQYKQESLRER